jgi:hypothetical protein
LKGTPHKDILDVPAGYQPPSNPARLELARVALERAGFPNVTADVIPANPVSAVKDVWGRLTEPDPKPIPSK